MAQLLPSLRLLGTPTTTLTSTDIVVPPGRISEIINGKRGITADTALRLAKFFGVSAELWLGLQAEYDLRIAKQAVGEDIN